MDLIKLYIIFSLLQQLVYMKSNKPHCLIYYSRKSASIEWGKWLDIQRIEFFNCPRKVSEPYSLNPAKSDLQRLTTQW